MSDIIDFKVVKQNKEASIAPLDDCVRNCTHSINETTKVMTVDKISVNDNKFLKIKEAGNFGSRFYYAERLGIDSVAFILYDKANDMYAMINEYKPPIDKFMLTAFGGSLDKDVSKQQIVKEEVLEEAGYQVEFKNISHLGRMFVSTQMNQFCYLYLVDVTNCEFVGRQPQNESEASATVVWGVKEDIIDCSQDWKAIAILSRLN